MNDLTSSNAAMPSLAGNLPLELVIDMGMEKMSRDYKYLLLSANLADLHDMRVKFSNVSTEEFDTNNYRFDFLPYFCFLFNQTGIKFMSSCDFPKLLENYCWIWLEFTSASSFCSLYKTIWIAHWTRHTHFSITLLNCIHRTNRRLNLLLI